MRYVFLLLLTIPLFTNAQLRQGYKLVDTICTCGIVKNQHFKRDGTTNRLHDFKGKKHGSTLIGVYDSLAIWKEKYNDKVLSFVDSFFIKTRIGYKADHSLMRLELRKLDDSLRKNWIPMVRWEPTLGTYQEVWHRPQYFTW